MQAKVERIQVDENKRIIAISDIHGDLNGLKRLLQKVDFTSNDVLFIIGDMIEKGYQNLGTLQYIMNLCKNYTVHVVCGNCDAIANEIYCKKENKDLLSYLIWRKNSIINEMCEALSIKLTIESDLKTVKETLKKYFLEELEFIKGLPDIIETQKFIFVHAGLTSQKLDEQKATHVRRMDAFLKQELSFDKYCVVGHWPVVLYCANIPSCNPIIDREHKIISIDGGNVLKRDGQLNAFIIPNMNSEDFTFESQDDLKSGVALDTQVANECSRCIPWIDNKIEVLKSEQEFSYCEQLSTKYRMWILNKYVIKGKNGCQCEDSTDYQIAVEAGETVAVVEISEKGYLIKRNGISGWYYGKLKIDETDRDKTDRDETDKR